MKYQIGVAAEDDDKILVHDNEDIFLAGGKLGLDKIREMVKAANETERLREQVREMATALDACEKIMRGARVMLVKHCPNVRLEVHDAVAAQAVAALAKYRKENP